MPPRGATDDATVPRPRPLMVGMGWPSRVPGGLNRYVADLHAAFLALGAAPVTAVFDADPFVAGLLDAGSEDAPLPLRLARMTCVVGRGARAARPDVLVSHFALYGLLPSLDPWRGRRRRLVVHFHGPWADESASTRGARSASRLKSGLEEAVYRRAAAVVVLSHEFAALVVQRYGVRPERVHVVAPGVDLQRFRPLDAADRAQARARLGISDDTHVVLTVRRLVARTGVDVLLDAWAALPPCRDDGSALVVVAGDGPDRAALERRARDGGIGNVRFVGRVSEADLLLWNQVADVAVVPSLHLEGFGLVVLEALACGTPVLASALGGMGEVLPDLDASLVVPAGDVEALRDRLMAAREGQLPDRESCRNFSARFAWPTVAERLLDLYAPVPVP